MGVLTNEEVQEFKRITLKVYGRELTDEEAQDQGTRLVTAFELILKHKQKEKNLPHNESDSAT